MVFPKIDLYDGRSRVVLEREERMSIKDPKCVMMLPLLIAISVSHGAGDPLVRPRTGEALTLPANGFNKFAPERERDWYQ